MKRFFKYIACAGVLATALASCNSEESITPTPVSELRAESTPGRIVLRWNTPDDGTVRYVKVKYFNPLSNSDEIRLASIYADSIEIPETRAVCGTYHFNVTSVSSTGDESDVQTIDKNSEAVVASVMKTQVNLTAADLYTNAQEASEGPITNLLDGSTSTFFHTTWNNPPAAPHYIVITCPDPIDGDWEFEYGPRNNANNKPTEFTLYGSNDNENWLPMRTFTKEADNLPVTASDIYHSPKMDVTSPEWNESCADLKSFKYLKYSVTKTNSGSVFWTMSYWKMWTYKYTDPEKEAAEILASYQNK